MSLPARRNCHACESEKGQGMKSPIRLPLTDSAAPLADDANSPDEIADYVFRRAGADRDRPGVWLQCAAGGLCVLTIRRLVRGDTPTVSTRLRDQITDLYDAWWDKRAPERTRFERAAATAARRKAIAGNWCAGAGLDDELDTPATGRPAAGNPPPAPASPPTSTRPHHIGSPSAHDTANQRRPHQQRPHHPHRPPSPRRPAWLPGRRMDRNSAITAMVLADTAGSGALHHEHRLWPHIDCWTAELGLSTPDALTLISRPPESISGRMPPQRKPTLKQPHHELQPSV
jgi:hypothetical protein